MNLARRVPRPRTRPASSRRNAGFCGRCVAQTAMHGRRAVDAATTTVPRRVPREEHATGRVAETSLRGRRVVDATTESAPRRALREDRSTCDVAETTLYGRLIVGAATAGVSHRTPLEGCVTGCVHPENRCCRLIAARFAIPAEVRVSIHATFGNTALTFRGASCVAVAVASGTSEARRKFRCASTIDALAALTHMSATSAVVRIGGVRASRCATRCGSAAGRSGATIPGRSGAAIARRSRAATLTCGGRAASASARIAGSHADVVRALKSGVAGCVWEAGAIGSARGAAGSRIAVVTGRCGHQHGHSHEEKLVHSHRLTPIPLSVAEAFHAHSRSASVAEKAA